ncbi:PCP reductase family protein [Proteinivorax hydrogeniformans]|uniref:PCP reductase family protein n=1 Tax=Proteinivorax hydrogeniformans TaxID=1826727 RepID=A0AAU8HVF8_9FIRM
MKWSKEAEKRIQKATVFYRGFAKKKAEEMAASRGKKIVEVEDIEKAKKGKEMEILAK